MLWWHFIIDITVLEYHEGKNATQGKSIVAEYSSMTQYSNATNLKCLHTAGVVSSKSPEDAAVQFVSKQQH